MRLDREQKMKSHIHMLRSGRSGGGARSGYRDNRVYLPEQVGRPQVSQIKVTQDAASNGCGIDGQDLVIRSVLIVEFKL